VIPTLYAWKSVKYVEAIEFLPRLRRGFWEERGYHDRGARNASVPKGFRVRLIYGMCHPNFGLQK
jgi:DMSO/TMAO reductase YedYZ molybdopterin-dependent catalytic subunit